MKLLNYHASYAQNWQGRRDGDAQRFFQIVKLLDVNANPRIDSSLGTRIALIGFACDVGIRRNEGRAGAALGPQEFRKHFANLAIPVESKLELYDLGDIQCKGEALEAAHGDLASIVKWARDRKLLPVVIGGGHEVSFGAYLGAAQSLKQSVGIINFDAHFDLRSYKTKGSNSGSSFLQIADWCEQQKQPFGYLVGGIQPAANTSSLFEQARKLNATWFTAAQVNGHLAECQKILANFIAQYQKIYLTLCLDVLAQAYAPGVSAPQPLGLRPEQLLIFLDQVIQSRKIIAIDIAEYSPPLDEQSRTGKLCAALVYHLLSGLDI